MNKVAIIGYGCAAAECIKEIRKNRYAGEIHVFTDSKWPVYNPMFTTYYVAGKISFDRLFPYGKDDKFCRDYDVNVHLDSPVINLNAKERLITNQAGFKFNYGQCLIASGASPSLPQVENISSKKVYLIRTPEDAIKLKEALNKRPEKALVIGASMIGIKLVELLYNAGIEVYLVDSADRIFPLIAHPEGSQIITDRLIKSGVKLKFGVNITQIEEHSAGIRVYFNDNENLDTDLVISCIGVQPNIDFIDCTQVEVKQGTLVNEQMMTNISGLYAAGDVAQGKNLLTQTPQIIGLWANARYQGRTAGSA
jgi:NAD(P)H-nitrite reductase large subunit